MFFREKKKDIFLIFFLTFLFLKIKNGFKNSKQTYLVGEVSDKKGVLFENFKKNFKKKSLKVTFLKI